VTTLRGRLGTMSALVCGLVVAAAACGGDGGGTNGGEGRAGVGFDTAGVSSTIDHPYVAFAAVRRAVYDGTEVDPDTGDAIPIRVESTPRRESGSVAGLEVTVVAVSDYEDGALVEQTDDYYAQDRAGAVYYLGERVDDYEDGKVVGHHGQWLAGEDGHRAGVFMPARVEIGTEFAQERVPGVAEDRSTVVATGLTVTVPAGTFADCIETEDYDPIDDVTEHKFYCAGVGLVREAFPAGGSLDLVELDTA
jgi:hypothetical protein